jgi:hypothetical protein
MMCVGVTETCCDRHSEYMLYWTVGLIGNRDVTLMVIAQPRSGLSNAVISKLKLNLHLTWIHLHGESCSSNHYFSSRNFWSITRTYTISTLLDCSVLLRDDPVHQVQELDCFTYNTICLLCWKKGE